MFNDVISATRHYDATPDSLRQLINTVRAAAELRQISISQRVTLNRIYCVKNVVPYLRKFT